MRPQFSQLPPPRGGTPRFLRPAVDRRWALRVVAAPAAAAVRPQVEYGADARVGAPQTTKSPGAHFGFILPHVPQPPSESGREARRSELQPQSEWCARQSSPLNSHRIKCRQVRGSTIPDRPLASLFAPIPPRDTPYPVTGPPPYSGPGGGDLLGPGGPGSGRRPSHLPPPQGSLGPVIR